MPFYPVWRSPPHLEPFLWKWTMQPISKRRCCRCRETKPLSEFGRDCTKPLGRAYCCRQCAAGYQQIYRQTEKGKLSHRRDAKKYGRANRRKIRLYQVSWGKASPDKLRAYRAQWRKAHPNYAPNWEKTHPRKNDASQTKWRKLNPDKVRDKNARRRAMKARARTEKVERLLVYDRDKGFCHICGVAVFHENWHLDHIIPLSKGGEHNYRNVAVSHPRCNMQKAAS